MQMTVQIGGEEFEIPQVIDLATFERVMAWDIEDPTHHKPIVATVVGCTIKQLDLLDVSTFELILATVYTRFSLDKLELKRTIGLYNLKSFDDLTFGEFIDMDLMVIDGWGKHASEVTSRIYGAPENVTRTWSVVDALQSCINLVKWRNQLYKEYDEFFEIDIEDEGQNENANPQRVQLMWYEAVLILAEGQFLNISKVVERPVREALNFLTWKKNQIAKQKLEQVKQKYDLQKRTR